MTERPEGLDDLLDHVAAHMPEEHLDAVAAQMTHEQLASLAVNAANALRDAKRHYEIASQVNAKLRVELKTLERATAFRVPYWEGDARLQYLLVEHDPKYKGWGVREGNGLWAQGWVDGEWRGYSGELREEAYSYTREEALEIAEREALALNAHIVEVMEGQFPGQFKGGPYDMGGQSGE